MKDNETQVLRTTIEIINKHRRKDYEKYNTLLKSFTELAEENKELKSKLKYANTFVKDEVLKTTKVTYADLFDDSVKNAFKEVGEFKDSKIKELEESLKAAQEELEAQREINVAGLGYANHARNIVECCMMAKKLINEDKKKKALMNIENIIEDVQTKLKEL